MVSVEGILIQLIFEHSLRVRLHYDPNDDSKRDQSKTKSESKNLIGRINTLATTDLANVLGRSTYWITGLYLVAILSHRLTDFQSCFSPSKLHCASSFYMSLLAGGRLLNLSGHQVKLTTYTQCTCWSRRSAREYYGLFVDCSRKL